MEGPTEYGASGSYKAISRRTWQSPEERLMAVVVSFATHPAGGEAGGEAGSGCGGSPSASASSTVKPRAWADAELAGAGPCRAPRESGTSISRNTQHPPIGDSTVFVRR